MKKAIFCSLAFVACASAPNPDVRRQAPLVKPSASTSLPEDATHTAGDAGASVSKEDAIIAKMLKRVSKIRGLAVKRPVKGKRLERTELIARIRAKVDKEIPPEAIALEGDTLKLYGFIPPELDYLDTTMKLLEAQLAGFYEPNDEHMYLAGDLDGMNGAITLAHELQHALQDQHFDLKKRSGYRPGHGDEQGAFSALCEGDATSVMIDVTVARVKEGMTALDVGDDKLEREIAGGVEADPSTKAIPHVMKVDLVAPYVYGTHFVHALRRQGGWEAVNGAFHRPPTSSEQILHPEKWMQNEQPLNVPAPPGPTADWKLADEDTTGELALAMGIGEWTSKDEGFRLAEGWGGDRDGTYVKGNQIVNITRVEYDANVPTRAREAQKRLSESLAKTNTLRDKDFACMDRPALGPLAFAVKERRLLLIAGPANRAPKWSSAASCKDAAFRKWVTAALAAP